MNLTFWKKYQILKANFLIYKRKEYIVFVYLISGFNDGILMYKIGISKDYKRRLKQLKTANPTINIVSIYESKNYKKIELSLHRKYNTKKFAGEWFILDEIDVKFFQEECKLLDKNLNIIEGENTYINNNIL